MTPDWPDGDGWMADAVPRSDFRLDAGFMTWPFAPNWILPDGMQDQPLLSRPELPHLSGHVLTADAAARPDMLVRYFTQLPALPPPHRRHETAPWNSLEVNVLIDVPGHHPAIADSFGPSIRAAQALLDALGDTAAAPGTVYDNLDQGWALKIAVQPDAVIVLDWDCDAHRTHARRPGRGGSRAPPSPRRRRPRGTGWRPCIAAWWRSAAWIGGITRPVDGLPSTLTGRILR